MRDPVKLKASKTAWNDRNREAIAAKKRAYRAANPDYVAQEKVRKAAHYQANKSRILKAWREKHGIVDAHGETREGECPICLRFGKLCLDHTPATGKIRGWLCLGCNTKLGWYEKPGRAERLADYLTRTRA